MDLKQFVVETVLSLNDAMIEIEERDGGHFRLAGGDRKAKDYHDFGAIRFDVAVFAGDEKTDKKGGDLGARIHVVSAGGSIEHSSNSTNQSTSRISFELVMSELDDRKLSISTEAARTKPKAPVVSNDDRGTPVLTQNVEWQ